MGTVRYTVLDGEIISERRNGVLHDYMVDPLGSTIGLVDSTQSVTDTFAYSPFGEVVSRTGTTATPFQYVGSQGYYKDSSSRSYVRARTLNVNLGRWMTQDPIGFEGGDYNLYRYVENNLVNLIDRKGLEPDINNMFLCPDKDNSNCDKQIDRVGAPNIRQAPKVACGYINSYAGLPTQSSEFISCIQNGEKKYNLKCIPPKMDGDLPSCLKNICSGNTGASISCKDSCPPDAKHKHSICGEAKISRRFGVPRTNCNITLCVAQHEFGGGGCNNNFDKTLPALIGTIIHEMLHCCGVKHDLNGSKQDDTCNDLITCCFLNAVRRRGERNAC